MYSSNIHFYVIKISVKQYAAFERDALHSQLYPFSVNLLLRVSLEKDCVREWKIELRKCAAIPKQSHEYRKMIMTQAICTLYNTSQHKIIPRNI